MSKIFSPKAWYLFGIGAAALAADGVRRLVKRRRRKAEEAPVTHTIETEQYIPMAPEAEIEPTPVIVEKSAPASEPAKTSPVAKKPEAATVDDLTQIKGIGPTLAKRLTDAGITTYAALADASPDYLREVTNAPAVANPDEWIVQARQMS